MTAISIRRAGIGDSGLAARVAEKFLDAWNLSASALSSLLQEERNTVLVAEADGEPVGFLLAYEFPSLSGERLVYLYDIAVERERRRSGIARALVSELKHLSQARGVNRIWVGSSASNTPACSLWEATGALREPEPYVEFVYPLAASGGTQFADSRRKNTPRRKNSRRCSTR